MDFKTLRECAAAYNAVYDQELRQEIKEQQEFENWVNSLVEEGYDLSEYTWEEMYEAYIDEAGNPGGAIAATQQRQKQAQAQGAKQALQQGKTLGVAGNFGMQSGTKVKMDSAATKAQGRTVVTSTNPQNRGARGGTTQTRPNTIQLGGQKMYAAKLGGKDVYVGAKKPGATTPAAKPAPSPAAKPTPAATKPAPTPAATKPAPTPAATKPAPTPAAKPAPTPAAKTAPEAKVGPAPTTSTASAAKPSAMDQWAKANPRLAQAQKIRQQGGSRAEVNKALYNKGTAPTTSTPTVVKAGVDLFDIIQGYLLDEGYAETLQEAEWMMANLIDEEAIAIILGESAIGTMAVLGGMAAGRDIHGKLQDRKAKKELEGKRRTSDYLTMKSRTKNAVFRDRRDSGDTRNEEYVDEAQHARENPEKYEREQEKKSAPVRGERTPMPPRGDKRREEFEKWYAKQMGR